MQRLPFYHTFKEFQDNYNSDFENWHKDEPEGDEVRFLKCALYTAGFIGYTHFDRIEMKYNVVDMSIGADGITHQYDIENYASIVIGNIHNNITRKFGLKNPNELGEFLYDFTDNLYDYIGDKRFDVLFFDARILISFFHIQKFTPRYRTGYNEQGEYMYDAEGEVLQEEGNFKEGVIFFDYEKYDVFLDEVGKIINFIKSKIEIEPSHSKKKIKAKLSNPQKLALLHELGFFDLPVFESLTETRVNEITGLLLEADPKEFVYKNRLNLRSKSPEYQINKYTAYQYLEEMKKLIPNAY